MTIRQRSHHRIFAGAALSVLALSLAHAQDGERVVPIDKVLLSNRLSDPVGVLLLPDVGTYQLGGGKAQEFACAIVKGFALSADGTKYQADCGKHYAVTKHGQALAIVELVLNKDRP